MRIITDNNDIVMYFGEDLTLTSDYAVIERNRDRRLTTANATIYTVPSLPRYFKGRCYTYTPESGFEMTSSGRAIIEAEALPKMIANIKAIANQKILTIAPEWKQRNMLAAGLDLQNVGPENWTEDQAALAAAIKSVWARVEAIRDYSNALEENITLETNINAGWPE